MVIGDITAVFFFAIVAYLISNFSQNMTIVLGASLVLTNAISYNQRNFSRNDPVDKD